MIEQSNDNETAAKVIKMLNIQPKIKLSKKWRPANWVNKQKDFMEINVGETRAYFKNGMEEYESGATAMLSARDEWWIAQVNNLFRNKVEYCSNPDVYCVHCDDRHKESCVWNSWEQLKKEIEGK